MNNLELYDIIVISDYDNTQIDVQLEEIICLDQNAKNKQIIGYWAKVIGENRVKLVIPSDPYRKYIIQ